MPRPLRAARLCSSTRWKLSYVGLLLILVATLGACAEAETGTGSNPLQDAGTDGGDPTDASTVDATDAVLEPRVSACVLGEQGPGGDCADPEQLDFGTVAVGEAAERLFRIDNDGGTEVTFTGVEIDAAEFAVTTVTYSQDSTGPNAFERTEVQLPVTRQPGEALYFEVVFTAGSQAGPLPADEVRVVVDLSTRSDTVTVPMVGQMSGCPEGLGDCDGDPSNGCETDTSAAMDHCGGCGQVCDLRNAGETCNAGVCEVDTCEEGFEDCDGTADNGCEIDVTSNIDNCGGCGAVCDLDNGTEICNDGACEVDSCTATYDDCNGVAWDGCEVDTTTSVDHCGACGQSCVLDHATARCNEGSCAIDSCDVGFEDCDGDPTNGCETNTQTDAGNCGGCGNVCDVSGGNSVCIDSNCTIGNCDAGYQDCDGDPTNGCEVNLETDVANCGTCGTTCTNDHGSTTCTTGACEPTCSGLWDSCDGDPDNGCETALSTLTDCGACGVTCDLPNASETCSSGTCELGACDAGWADCDGDPSNGCEVDLNSDLANCGACGTTCSNANGSTTCNMGTCEPTCSGLWDDCDGDLTNGCETSLSDLSNCGACGSTCELSNAGETCQSGTCELGSCEAGYQDCDGTISNGCEVNTTSDVANCGACGNMCTNANGSTSCSSGTCAPLCASGYGSCDGDASDGCETQLNTLSNCGACGNTCSLPNAVETCSTGACELVACEAGFADCDGVVSNGCEVNLASDVSNCGACGNTCTNPFGSTSCTGGSCVPSCTTGYDSCDSNPDNGCETSLNTLSNCGACDSSCALSNASEICSAQTCQVSSCDSGYSNCDGSDANGCEVNVSSDVNNCGSCGNQCTNAHGTTSCASGACAPSCDTGYDDCNGVASDGCETAIDTVSNCGACGNTCDLPNATAGCSSGGCVVVACDAGYANCDGVDSNGCEVNIGTDADNCGACGYTCTNAHGSTSCSGGSCSPTCSSGWDSCDGDPDDGCETSLTTNSNCGSCGTTCSLSNASQSCSTGSCQVTDCYNKWCDANGYDFDGCEFDLDTNPSCGSASYAGAVSGDTGGGGDTITISGRGERWYRVRVREDSNNIEGPKVKITLNSPSGTDYDLEGYCSSCSGSSDTSYSSGSVDSIGFQWGDSWGSTDTEDIYIKVEAFNADVCANWTLTIAGDVTTSSPSGC